MAVAGWQWPMAVRMSFEWACLEHYWPSCGYFGVAVAVAGCGWVAVARWQCGSGCNSGSGRLRSEQASNGINWSSIGRVGSTLPQVWLWQWQWLGGSVGKNFRNYINI
jgi:hypothetical protein